MEPVRLRQAGRRTRPRETALKSPQRSLAPGMIGLLCLQLAAASAQPTDLHFRHLSIEQGLSQSIVTAMLQDRQGFMWFVTEDGLNRFDGYSFKIFKHDARDPSSLIHNEIKCIHEDREGMLWVGSFHRGLERFDPSTGRFTHFQHDPGDSNSLGNDIVWAVLEDRQGRLWVGTGGGGLDLLDRGRGVFSHHRHDPLDAGSLGHDDVRVLCQDREGAIWVGTAGGGLSRLDPATGRCSHFRHDPADPRSLSHDDVRSLVEDRDGALWVGTRGGGLCRLARGAEGFDRFRHSPDDEQSLANDVVLALQIDAAGVLWVGTDGGGLNRFHRARGTFSRYRHDPHRPASLAGDRVHSICQDRAGVLWVGTYGNGCSRCNLNRKPFRHHANDPSDPGSLNDNIVWSFCEDPAGILWMGTNDGGLNRFDRAAGRFTSYRHDPADPRSLGHNSIRMVIRDREGRLWLATNGGGLDRFDPATGACRHYRHDPRDPRSLSHNELRMVFEDREGAIWVGTYGGGLDRWDPATDGFAHHRHDPRAPRTISNDYVRAACEDAAGILWFGTHGGGLNRFDRAAGAFTTYRNDPEDPATLSNDFVFSLHEDRAGNLWVATYGGGLNLLDRENGVFTTIRKSDGLPDDAVYGILEDARGHLWLSTNSGIARFDPASRAVKTYTIADGLQSNEFNGGAYYQSARGEMFFGGINGFNSFFPEEIRDSDYHAPVVFTDFQLSNQTVPLGPMPDGRVLLERAVSHANRIELTHRDRVVSFEFAALDYTAPENNRYAYRLEGLQSEWVDLGTRRFVMFTTLPAGRYSLRVKGTNSDGVWDEAGTALAIRVRPPWWNTAWAYSALGLALMGAVLGIVRFEKARERARGELVEAELRAQAAELQSRAVQAESHALKAENERKTAELDEARKLQLSMLPAHLPRHPLYAVTALMRTATEVGGDYYDYHVEADGTLTVAIGDATGHGTRAGIMVAIMKGLFVRMCSEPHLPVILSECNRTLCRINLDQMFMALGLLRLKRYEAAAVAAAMPSIFIWRAQTGEVEEVKVIGLLLGMDFELPYQEVRFTLRPGDKVLLLSDGYLEQRNRDDEMLDFDRCRAYFGEAAHGAAERIIQHLFARFDAWRGPVPQGDDVTLVILEVRPERRPV